MPQEARFLDNDKTILLLLACELGKDHHYHYFCLLYLCYSPEDDQGVQKAHKN